jgi:hypothetical protein
LIPTSDNLAVGLETRRGLRRWVAAGMLDEPSATLVERALDKSRSTSASGWALRLAQALGAPEDRAMHAAVVSEWVYATVDVTDDVQDGDAFCYLAVPPAVQINLSVHLVALALYAASSFCDLELTRQASALFSRMACGQRLEIARDDWSVESYERMARLTGSCQFELYFRVCAWAAGSDPTSLLALAQPLGILIHMAADGQSHDPRLGSLEPADTRALRSRACSELAVAQAAIPVAARRALATLLAMARCEP